MNNLLSPTIEWIKEDFKAYPLRFCIELFAWATSIGCSITMAVTVPNPPLPYMYPVWITSCGMYAWAAWTRKSFGMLANYMLLVGIDVVGFTNLMVG